MSGESLKQEHDMDEEEPYIFESLEMEDEVEVDPLADVEVNRTNKAFVIDTLLNKLNESRKNTRIGVEDRREKVIARKGKVVSSSENYLVNKPSEQCIFCVRIPREKVNYSSTSSPSLLSTLNQIWPYLRQKFEDSVNLISFLEKCYGKTGKITGFNQLPTMCSTCLDILISMDKHLVSLWAQIQKLGCIARKSSAEIFEKTVVENSKLKYFQDNKLESDIPSPEWESGAEDPVDNDSDPDYIKSENEDDPNSSTDESIDASPGTDNTPGIPVKRRYTRISTNREQKKIRLKYVNIIKTVDEKLGIITFTCALPSCGKTFSKRRNAAAHQKRVHKVDGDPRVECDLCGKKVQNLVKHKGEVHRGKLPRNKCDVCREEIDKNSFFEHVRAHVGEEYVSKCENPDCQFSFTQPLSLTRHLESSLNCRRYAPTGERSRKRIYTCEICDYSTSFSQSLICHLTENHENATKNYSCPISGCGQTFTEKQSVVHHLPRHDFCRNWSSQRCPKCLEIIKIAEMEAHLNDKHQVLDIIKCKQCSLLFSTRKQILDHLYDHRFGELLRCHICEDGVQYSGYVSLREHYFKEHKIGLKVSCEFCDKGFWTSDELKFHIQQVHKKIESSPNPEKTKTPDKQQEFKCLVDGCGKSFHLKQTLYLHHRTVHLGVKHFCDVCGKSYSSSTKLKAHKNIIHLGILPFICDECGQSFGDGCSFRRHKLIHTGEKPFVCDICGQRFRHRESLKAHLEGHEKKGTDFKPNGPMKPSRKRAKRK